MSVQTFVSEYWQAALYFVVLGWSMAYCLATSRPWAAGISLACIAVTWFYILRGTRAFVRAGVEDWFDQAYVDVLVEKHWATSSQLLTWVVVSVTWLHEASLHYTMFGMLGAMCSSFSTWISNGAKSGRWIPWPYVPAMGLTLYGIVQLSWTLDDRPAFAYWLRVVHLALVAPRLVSLVWPTTPTVDGRYFYPVLGLASMAIHLWSRRRHGETWVWPVTDCQISITVDLVVCSLLTLLVVWRQTGGSVLRTSFYALLIPLVSPGAVLALHLTMVHSTHLHLELIWWLQDRVAQRLSASDGKPCHWRNVGLWLSKEGAKEGSYVAACERLARALGDAVLEKGDRVLDCGVGRGAEVGFLKKEYELGHITGIDLDKSACEAFERREQTRVFHLDAASITDRFLPGQFNRVIALDNVYHYPDKLKFFNDAFELLPTGGKIGVTDLYVKHYDRLPWILRQLVTEALRLSGVQVRHLWSEPKYLVELTAAGFTDVKIEPIDEAVLGEGTLLGTLLPIGGSTIASHIGMCIVTARKPGIEPRRPRVAVVGSGLSGMTTAYRLSPSFDVTVFEAGARPGLSGRGETLGDQPVDVPLRMINPRYYLKLMGLLDELQVRTTRSFADCCFYGNSRPGPINYKQSAVQDWWTFLSKMSDWRRLCDSVRTSTLSEKDKKTTFGEWLESTGDWSDSDAMWTILATMSWMLSCTFDQVKGYPAKIILDFCKTINIGSKESMSATFLDASAIGDASIRRVNPCIDELRRRLNYGSKLRVNCPVPAVPHDRVLFGEQYDVIVIATEAQVVPKLLPPGPDANVFKQVPYAPSSIIIHTDPAVMPEKKRDWQALNVKWDNEKEACQLTCWLNKYYPEADFPSNMFQTWYPYERPPKDKIVKEMWFTRAVYTKDSVDTLQAIRDLQGKHGIFFAGAYVEFGMGLLEQAATSGVNAAKLVTEYLEKTRPGGEFSG